MKSIFKAAMMTAVAVAAFGADPMARLQVTFPFTVGKTTMPAGEYRISMGPTGRNALRIESFGEGPSAFLALPVQDLTTVSETKRQVEFVCESQICTISRVVNLHGGYTYSAAKRTGAQAKIVAVKLTTGKTRGE